MQAHEHFISAIQEHAIPLDAQSPDFSPLLSLVSDARFVLIGEATHGTEEFYHLRAELTKELIRHYGFAAVAVEGDWPDCYRVNRYVQGDETIENSDSALSAFTRFPNWMWRNNVMTAFVDWLYQYNRTRPLLQEKIAFYGLDLYSLHASIEAVIHYLEKIDPQAAERARHYYGCFGHYYRKHPQEYGYAASFGLTKPCKEAVLHQLITLRQKAHEYSKRDGYLAEEEFFCTEQNAKLILDAENYYRTMFEGRISSWNVRDQHMVDSLHNIAAHVSERRNETAKIVIWAHNSHIGDARATEMGDVGEWNIGQLVREHYGTQQTKLIGFSTYQGTVTAASKWDAIAERKTVRPALKESYEDIFHRTAIPNFTLTLTGNDPLHAHLRLPRLQRAIGVVYVPETERQSHYFFSRLTDQFDAIIHIDETTALTPLEVTHLWQKGEMLETYPTGL